MDPIGTHEALARTALLLDDGDNRFLATFGLNRSQYAALQMLDAAEGRRLVDLAAGLLCERSTVTRIIDRLESLDLVQRLADAADRRSQRVVLTPEGVSLRERVTLQFERSLRGRFAVLNEAEQVQLVELLQKLGTSLTAPPAEQQT